MQNMSNALPIRTTLDKAKEHVLFHHHEADGWITLAKKCKKGSWRQYHYKPEELSSVLKEWEGEDVFFSQNSFFKPQRRLENIRQLRSIYVDIDCHQLDFDPEWVYGKLTLEVFGTTLPYPNHVIFSGRGLVCVWLIEPVPKRALPLWQAVQSYFFEQLKYVGADPMSTDATRVFRIAGTRNSKNGREVRLHICHDHRSTLRELQEEYLPELLSPNRTSKEAKVYCLTNLYNLHYNRLLDIEKLAELRNYDMKGYRELFCFLYRYWSCCFTQDTNESLKRTLEINLAFTSPLPEKEVVRATLSAEKAWQARHDETANIIAFEKGYPGAGYNLKNTTIIEWFNITSEEQQHLKTIIDNEEKQRRKKQRDKEYQENNRRNRGDLEREVYLKNRSDKAHEHLHTLRELLAQNPTITKRVLASILGLSIPRIKQLKQSLKLKYEHL
ncbi:replication protein [Bacillus sp. FJAT-45350]|uniref:replication protein n=1 Tax=Bacillus sp. FJAT-45350 TaxID=2011014 RepID=UPI000BB92030|nr:replication protein [Bacillus sp. FJAT-45350]